MEFKWTTINKDHYLKYVYDGLKDFFNFPKPQIDSWTEKYISTNYNIEAK